jgi:hypothetical protein
MDRPIEDRLIAMLEAVDAPLSRRAIYSRVDEDFDSEEDLARRDQRRRQDDPARAGRYRVRRAVPRAHAAHLEARGMSFSLSAARATITKLTLDKKPGDDGAKEVSTALKVEVKTSADILAEFHPSLRAALFVRDAGVRFRSMKEIGWEGTRRGIDLAIRPGPDIKPAVKLTDVTLRDFKLKPIEEGSQQLIGIKFTVDVDEAPVARILEYLKEESWIDIHGGGELDLAPPSAKETIEGMEDPAPAPPVSAGRPRRHAAGDG